MVPAVGWPGFGWPSGPLGKSKGGSGKVCCEKLRDPSRRQHLDLEKLNDVVTWPESRGSMWAVSRRPRWAFQVRRRGTLSLPVREACPGRGDGVTSWGARWERSGLWGCPALRLLGLAKFGRGPARPDFEVGLAGHVESPLRPRFALKIRAAPLLWCRSSSFSVHVGRTTWLFRDMQLSVCQQIERNHRCWRWLGLRCSS